MEPDTIQTKETPDGLSDKSRGVIGDEQHSILSFLDKSVEKANAGSFDMKRFFNFYKSLECNGWTGKISVYAASCTRAVYLFEGQMVYASSDHVDDRMGSICYREGIISLETMMDVAVQVTEEMKFGQVCVAQEIFSYDELWFALQEQSAQILKSIFSYSRVTVLLESGVRPPAELPITIDAGDLYAYGCMFRSFQSRLSEATLFNVCSKWVDERKAEEDTFMCDFLMLFDGYKSLEDVVEKSKLSNQNTIVELFHLYLAGGLVTKGLKNPEMAFSSPHMKRLRSIVETYEVVSLKVIDAFRDSDIDLPSSILNGYLQRTDSGHYSRLRVDEHLNLTQISIESIHGQCTDSSNNERVLLYEKRVRSLVQFLVYLACDALPRESSQRLKDFYKSLNEPQKIG